jgi:hypothetical protein
MAPPPLNTDAIKRCIDQGVEINSVMIQVSGSGSVYAVSLLELLGHRDNVEGLEYLVEQQKEGGFQGTQFMYAVR